MTSQTKSSLVLRFMAKDDYLGVVGLQRRYDEDPLDEGYLYQFLGRNRKAVLVAVREKVIVGYLAFRVRKQDLEILRLVVSIPQRRQGVGTLLVARLKEPFGNLERNQLTIPVRESNFGAQLFLKRRGFQWVLKSPGFYDLPPEDAYVFTWKRKPCTS